MRPIFVFFVPLWLSLEPWSVLTRLVASQLVPLKAIGVITEWPCRNSKGPRLEIAVELFGVSPRSSFSRCEFNNLKRGGAENAEQ